MLPFNAGRNIIVLTYAMEKYTIDVHPPVDNRNNIILLYSWNLDEYEIDE